MKRTFPARQAGISFFGLVIVLAVLAAGGVLLAQAIPTMVEYQAILKNVQRARDGAGGPVAIRQAFDRGADIDDIKSIRGKDLEITRVGDKDIVKFAYNKEIHMFGPAYLLLKYAGETQ